MFYSKVVFFYAYELQLDLENVLIYNSKLKNCSWKFANSNLRHTSVKDKLSSSQCHASCQGNVGLYSFKLLCVLLFIAINYLSNLVIGKLKNCCEARQSEKLLQGKLKF